MQHSLVYVVYFQGTQTSDEANNKDLKEFPIKVWRERSINWVSWKEVYKPKKEGVLAIINIEAFNIGLLEK